MGKREILKNQPRNYMERGRDGRFKNSVRIGRSLKADRNTMAKNISKPGYGHTGDQKKRLFRF